MVVKVFWLGSAAIVLSAVTLIVTGRFSNAIAIVYGLAAFGLTFMGMMMVLPHWLSHPEGPKVVESKVSNVVGAEAQPQHVGLLKSA